MLAQHDFTRTPTGLLTEKVISSLVEDDSVVTLEGTVLPNSANFASVRRALSEETVRVGQGDPL